MNHLQNIKVWYKSINLVTEVYLVTEKLPFNERYGLTSQIQRSAVSISSNIAEGAGRDSDKEFSYFLGVASGSSYELETQLIIGRNLNYLKDEDIAGLISEIHEIQKMIFSFKKQLKK